MRSIHFTNWYGLGSPSGSFWLRKKMARLQVFRSDHDLRRFGSTKMLNPDAPSPLPKKKSARLGDMISQSREEEFDAEAALVALLDDPDFALD